MKLVLAGGYDTQNLGDYAMLAENIRLLFTDDELAQWLAAQAQTVARARHDYATVGESLVAIYRSIVDGTTPSYIQKTT